jgi:hypothetical protein
MPGLASTIPAERALMEDTPTAAEVTRGLTRLFWRMGLACAAECPLGNGQRADLVALGRCGRLTIVEVKVSTADLRQDAKWRGYLDYCDRFYWAVPPGFPLAAFDAEAYGHGRAGLIVADWHDAAIVREAAWSPLPPARRKSETIRFAMRSADALMRMLDPGLVDPAT